MKPIDLTVWHHGGDGPVVIEIDDDDRGVVLELDPVSARAFAEMITLASFGVDR